MLLDPHRPFRHVPFPDPVKGEVAGELRRSVLGAPMVLKDDVKRDLDVHGAVRAPVLGCLWCTHYGPEPRPSICEQQGEEQGQ
eukprot:12770432-Heterocapsa_arctica.AAC.1